MADIQHNSLETTNLHVPGYVQSSDPGAVGAGKMWIDTSGGTGNWVNKIRNATDTGWEEAGGGAGGSGTSGYSGVSGYSGWSGPAGPGGSPGGTTYLAAITDGDLVSGVVDISHGLSNQTPIVAVYDNNYKLISPDEIQGTSSNNLSIDLLSYVPLTGTWYARIGSGGATYSASIVYADLASGIATVTHNLGSRTPAVTVYDNNYKIVATDLIQTVDVNSLTVDLSSFGVISGTWTIRVMV